MPLTGDATFMATATLGTTLAPWGLTFIQSYAVDKRLTRDDLRHLRMDVWIGSMLTAIIGFFVIVTCAATLHREGITINDASDAARALKPLAGELAQALFAVGLIGAALLAASILPLSTAYAMSDLTGRPAALDDAPSEAPLFYGTFVSVTVMAAAMILLPGIPLVTVLVASQVLNAVLLLPLMLYMYGIAGDRRLMGEYRSTRPMRAAYVVFIAIVAGCIVAMAWFSLH
jgi:Mn2+/Fe2+ NRAMP family transporter